VVVPRQHLFLVSRSKHLPWTGRAQAIACTSHAAGVAPSNVWYNGVFHAGTAFIAGVRCGHAR
jgi:hypothetical protein